VPEGLENTFVSVRVSRFACACVCVYLHVYRYVGVCVCEYASTDVFMYTGTNLC